MKLVIILLVLSISTVGCASYSHQVAPVKFPDSRYRGLTCKEIESEIKQNLDKQAQDAYIVDNNANTDTAIAWVGALFMPIVLVGLNGNGTETVELSVMKGKFEALSIAASEKNCKEAMQLVLHKDSILFQKRKELEEEEKKAEEKAAAEAEDSF